MESLTKELQETNQKIEARAREIEAKTSEIWTLKALLKSDLRHKEALEKALENKK